MRKSPRSHCPVSLALDAIGDKWSLLILRDMVLRGKRRYQDLLGAEERISTNILAARLARLEKQGLISRRADPGDKRQISYFPTQKALDLLPVIFEMARWSARYDPRTDPHNSFVQGMKAGEKGFRERFLARFNVTPHSGH
jgi:DNA-binding HxlR family transcriptional regulator